LIHTAKIALDTALAASGQEAPTREAYPQDIAGGFKITRKGLDFVREYFKN
jgi:hypothetical protein